MITAVNLFFVFIVGACVGSFLCLCVCRIPSGKSILFPGSTCECGAAIPFWKNIPLLSWLLLRGKASCCGRKIPFRYFEMELMAAVMFVSVFATSASLAHFIIGSTFCSLLLVIAFIDIDTMEIYDAMSVGGMVAGIAVSLIFPQWYGERSIASSFVDCTIGICFGSALMLSIAALGKIILKREAVGFGDVKLMGMIGGFIGWRGCFVALFGGCFISTAIAIPPLLVMKIIRRGAFKIPREIPFAPFLVIGSIAHILFGNRFLEFFLIV
ncbi:MAG: prepilin peptidase [Puniceicoccales bacterium]|jgi:leader peptidase (prepilin peptidase)/N-methyltransferase|nr:prepilin peptidase [Puniceicoccales bacterium]